MKETTKKCIRFTVALAVFAWIALVGKIGWLGSDLSASAGSAVKALFSKDLGGFQLTVPTVLCAVEALLFTWLLCTVLIWLIEHLSRSDRAKTVKALAVSVIRYLGVILGVVWALSTLGLDATAVFASIGIVALIVGFGAQSLIEDVISGLFIVFENQYNIGDIIVLDDFRGTVTRIGMRTTSLVDAGGNYKIVNNSDIRNIQNRSRATSLAISDVGISYDDDPRRVEKILFEAFPAMYENNKDVFLEAPGYLGVQENGDSAVVLRCCVKCTEENFYAATRRLNRELRILFIDKKVEIPYTQVDIHNR